MPRPILLALTAITLAPAATPTTALAAIIHPLSYDEPNGSGQASGGTYNYWDTSYTGAGAKTTDGAPLTGGLGKLTDGVIATSDWFNVSNPAGTGPHVGYLQTVTPSPIITFHFAPGTVIGAVTVYADNSGAGGVAAPASVVIDGVSHPGPATVDLTQDVLSFTGLALAGPDLTLQLIIRPTFSWAFLSEVTFDDGALSTGIPAPGMLVPVLAAALALRARTRR